ncbi:MAG: ribosome recycling factor [Gilvibacter sp.]
MEEEIQLIIESTREGMQGAIAHLEKKLINIRAGKATPSMVSSVMVDYYGSQTPLNQVANVNTPDGMTITIQPWEKALIPEIEKGIQMANLGFNPMNNGESVIINVPPLTEERRMELAKQARSEAEEAKIGVRNDRKTANNEIKNLDVSDDMKKNLEIDIQEMTDNFTKKIESILDAKEKEIMTV